MLLLRTIFLCMAIVFPAGVLAKSNEAREAFNQGTALFNKKQFTEAAIAFRRAYELKPTWKLLYNIGQAEAATKRYGVALEAFERYLSEGGDEIEISRRNEVLDEIRKLRDMVGDLKITGIANGTVYVDDVQRGELPLASTIPVSAGTEHHLVVRQGDTVLIDRTVRVRSSKTLAVTVNSMEDVAEQDAPNASAMADVAVADGEGNNTSMDLRDDAGQPTTAGGSRHSVLLKTGIVLLSVGGAVLVGGLVTGIMTLKKKDELESDCIDGVCYGGGTESIDDSRKTLALTTDALLFSGGGLAIAGGVLLLVALKKKRASAVSLHPVFSPGQAGIVLGGKF